MKPVYQNLRKLLFCLPPEIAHRLSLRGLDSPLGRCFQQNITEHPRRVFGIDFPNPIGLAAGLDKNADHLSALFRLGFGYVEVGTATPKAQSGNTTPRLFRLSKHQALINRLGFNNYGIDHLCANVENYRKNNPQAVIGINIGKNASTPIENALDDYLICLKRAYALASYITVNPSSPNTPGLRSLQYGSALRELLQGLQQEQTSQTQNLGRRVPILIKIAPDLSDEEIRDISNTFNELKVDGVIATNTSLQRSEVSDDPQSKQAGGLSGAPIFNQSTDVLRKLATQLDKNIPIIGVGGINSGAQAAIKIQAGAQLVQIYTGFIYQGPELIADAAAAINNS